MPKSKKLFSSPTTWWRRLTQFLVHAGWAWARRAGTVTREHPGRLRFGAIGDGTLLAFPQGTVFGEQWIRLGGHCIIAEQVTLTAGLGPGFDLGPDPLLRIGDGVVLGRGSHVIAYTKVTIGADCYFGPYVYVTSMNHSYDDPDEPIGRQWPRKAPVEIGPGCWIGTGAVILPGAVLGRNVVVAAGSVVRGRVPDHCVVAGAPARVVRRWCPDTGWQPPLRTPAPEPIPDGMTVEELLERVRQEEAAAEEARRAAADPVPLAGDDGAARTGGDATDAAGWQERGGAGKRAVAGRLDPAGERGAPPALEQAVTGVARQDTDRPEHDTGRGADRLVATEEGRPSA